MLITPVQRFLKRIRIVGDCWMWTGHLVDGYGYFMVNGKHVAIHRFSFERFNGPIPEGLILDHLCHKPELCVGGELCPHRACGNPDHLEPVTRIVNCLRGGSFSAVNARKTHCTNGHEYNEQNTYHYGGKSKFRTCRICNAAAVARYQERRTA